MNRRVLTFGLAIAAFAGGALIARHFTSARQSNRPVSLKLVAANSDFGVRLLKELVKAEPGKNVFISPSSLSLALSMAYNGADGTTKNAMAKILGYQAMTLDQVNDASEALLGSLQDQNTGIDLQVANSIWARQGVEFKDSFLDTNRRCYSAEVTTLPFDRSAVNTINSWVSDKTSGKIARIIDNIDPSEIMFLINAVYFKGQWSEEFDPANTQNRPFVLSSGRQVSVPMMAQQGEFAYAKTSNAGVLCLPYLGKRFGMWIVLPDKPNGLSAVLKSLTSAEIANWVAAARSQEVDMLVPKFKLDYGVQLKDALSGMGMGVAFDPVAADFGRMCRIPPTPNVFINQVTHKTFLEVDERGTVAAAVTAVAPATGVVLPGPILFNVDHPFLCLIRDNKTKAILFIGVVENPS